MYSSSTFSVSATSHQFLTESLSVRFAFLILPVFVIIYMPNPLVFPSKECLLWLSHWEMTKTCGFKIMKLQQKQPWYLSITSQSYEIYFTSTLKDWNLKIVPLPKVVAFESSRSSINANKSRNSNHSDWAAQTTRLIDPKAKNTSCQVVCLLNLLQEDCYLLSLSLVPAQC